MVKNSEGEMIVWTVGGNAKVETLLRFTGGRKAQICSEAKSKYVLEKGQDRKDKLRYTQRTVEEKKRETKYVKANCRRRESYGKGKRR